MVTFSGIPYERIVLGCAVIFALATCYDEIVVNWLEAHKPYIPAQTAVEVVIGVLGVLLIYLLVVQGVRITGVESFFLLFVFFAFAGAKMADGSKRRTSGTCKREPR